MSRSLITPADVAERVAELLPSLDVTSDAFRDACEGFAAHLNHDVSYDGPTRWTTDGVLMHDTSPAYGPAFPAFDPTKFYGARGGGINLADITATDAPDTVGKHVVKRGRSKRGATALVLRRGVAPVVGRMDVDVHGAPILSTPAEGSADVANPAWAMAQMLTRNVRRVPGGYSSADVLKVTNQGASLDDDLTMLGTDAMAWSEVVPGDRSSRCSVAVHTSDLSGMGGHATLGRFVAQTDAYAAHTDRQRWATRLRLPYRARKSDPTVSTVSCESAPMTFRVQIGPWWSTTRPDTLTPRYLNVTMSVPMTSRTVLPSAAADTERVHIGMATVARKARQDRDKHGTPVKRGAIKARTLAALDIDQTPDTADGWHELARVLNRGERITAADGAVVITRQLKSGAYRVADKRTDGATFTVRTLDALGARLATA